MIRSLLQRLGRHVRYRGLNLEQRAEMNRRLGTPAWTVQEDGRIHILGRGPTPFRVHDGEVVADDR